MLHKINELSSTPTSSYAHMLVSLVNRHLAYITVTKGRQTKAIHTTTTTTTHTQKYWKIMNSCNYERK
jgi:hypothetical protein